MKKENKQLQEDEMMPEYDFSGKKGVRGKYHKMYRQGHTVRIQETDGTVRVHYFTLEEGAVLLERDVREYFPTSESVNETLRTLIAIAPAKNVAQQEIAIAE